MDSKKLKIIKWTARIIALIIIIGGLPFYFGYGNPLPFIKQEYTLYDNLWLTVFPLMFIGLALGWKYEKIGGYLLITSLLMGNTKLFLKLRDTHLLDFLFTIFKTLYLQGFQTPFRHAPKTHGECL